ncbi:MAG: hypothetical protein FWG34_07025 [Oscillospiraceae bacterium]|nr:hypothetical protein [Oscillospiraceae bacterium]
MGDVKYIQKGTIQIDGMMDEAYAKSLSVPIDLLSSDTSSTRENYATGTAWLLWNEEGIYVFAEINDPTPTTPPSMVGMPMDSGLTEEYFIWNRDALEVFFEPTNSDSRAETYATHMCVDNAAYIYAGAYNDGDESDFFACLKVNGKEKEDMDYLVRVDPNDNKKYYVEMFFRLPGFSYKAGDKVGIMFQIDDMEKAIENFSNGEDRSVVINRCSAGDSTVVWDIPNHDYIVLSAEDVTPPPPAAEEEDVPAPAVEVELPAPAAPSPAPSAPEPSPQTGDMGMMFVLGAFALAGAFATRKSPAKK